MLNSMGGSGTMLSWYKLCRLFNHLGLPATLIRGHLVLFGGQT